MRLIDADALPFCPVNILHDGGIYKAVVVLSEDIGKAPAIEAEPVRHGRWELDKIVYDQDLFRCSECGRKELVYNRHSRDMTERYPYCHCGAKMDGGADHAGEGA